MHLTQYSNKRSCGYYLKALKHYDQCTTDKVKVVQVRVCVHSSTTRLHGSASRWSTSLFSLPISLRIFVQACIRLFDVKFNQIYLLVTLRKSQSVGWQFKWKLTLEPSELNCVINMRAHWHGTNGYYTGRVYNWTNASDRYIHDTPKTYIHNIYFLIKRHSRAVYTVHA